MHLSRYLKLYSDPDDPGRLLLYSTRRGAAILVPTSLPAAVEDGRLDPATTESLLRLGVLVADPQAEKEELRRAFAIANERQRNFRAIVVLNMECNLACSYCFEGGMKGAGRHMTPETAAALCEFIGCREIGAGGEIKVSFYGGEPLISLDLIEDLSRRLHAVAGAKGAGYSFTMVTNGTLLTRRAVDRLIPLGLSGAKVTLDGPPGIHDAYRPFVSGSGSFQTIIGNLKSIPPTLQIQVGGNYTRENFREFPRLLDLLLAEGLTPERIKLVKFDPVTKSVAELPPEFNDGCVSTEESWVAEASLYLREEILRRGFHTPRVGPAPCMIESTHDVVVNYDGTLYKCPALLGRKEMAVGDLGTGIGEYGTSHNLDVWKKDECLECAYLPLCFGGCRFLTYLREGRVADVDCRKRFFDATLEGLVRQDLRHRPRR